MGRMRNSWPVPQLWLSGQRPCTRSVLPRGALASRHRTKVTDAAMNSLLRFLPPKHTLRRARAAWWGRLRASLASTEERRCRTQGSRR